MIMERCMGIAMDVNLYAIVRLDGHALIRAGSRR